MSQNQPVDPSGYVFGDSTNKLFGKFFGDSGVYPMVRRRVTSVVRRLSQLK